MLWQPPEAVEHSEISGLHSLSTGTKLGYNSGLKQSLPGRMQSKKSPPLLPSSASKPSCSPSHFRSSSEVMPALTIATTYGFATSSKFQAQQHCQCLDLQILCQHLLASRQSTSVAIDTYGPALTCKGNLRHAVPLFLAWIQHTQLIKRLEIA